MGELRLPGGNIEYIEWGRYREFAAKLAPIAMFRDSRGGIALPTGGAAASHDPAAAHAADPGDRTRPWGGAVQADGTAGRAHRSRAPFAQGLKEARAIIAQAERLQDLAHRAERGEAGRVRLGVTISVPFMPSFTRAIRAFQCDFPGVAVDLALVNSSQALEALRQRKLDIGLIRPFSAPLPADWQQTTVERDRLMLVIPSGHPQAEACKVPLTAIADERFLLFPREHGTALYGQIMDIWARAGVIPRVAQEAENGPAILALVAAGLGNAILPSALSAMKVDSVVWKQIDIEVRWTCSSIVMVHRKEARDEKVQSHFIEYVHRSSHNGTS